MAMFKNIFVNKPKRSKFDLSHERKMTMQMGKLYPNYLQEVVPGDSFRHNAETLIRLQPMLSPVMHKVDVYTHFFFVPNRLVWNEWEDFITGGEDGNATPPFPTINLATNSNQYQKGSLADYLGIPPDANRSALQIEVNALPFRAYQLIYNEWYRDQDLEDKVPITKNSTISQPELTALSQLRNRSWEKDYFTSCRPDSQKGGEAQLPLGVAKTAVFLDESTFQPSTAAVTPVFVSDGGDDKEAGLYANDSTVTRKQLGLEVDATTINELRKANRLQKWLEKSMRGGSRYVEQILSHFGVKSSDARLQRPEYLGGGKQPVVISEVLATADSTTTPVGELNGHGISVGNSNSYSKTFEEHGFIVGIISVLPKTSYQQGLNRTWFKTDKFDYYWPEFAHLGEQEVKLPELYVGLDSVLEDNEETFGYQQRYAEYKYNPSTTHGDFRDNLAFWTMTRIFNSKPALNQQFVQSDPTKRIFAVEDPNVDELVVQIHHNISALRPMPYFSIPQL